MRIYYLLAWLGCLFLASYTIQAQTVSSTDVLLLTTGAELRGRVLTITPSEVSYLPAPDSVGRAPTPADTLHLPVATVFLVRYANGTREVLAPPVAGPPAGAPGTEPLLSLSSAQRRQQGQLDAQRYYHHGGPFWGAFGSTLYLGPVLGLAPTIGIGSSSVHTHNLRASQQLLLADPDYGQGYRQQANRAKRGRAWAGYGVATGVYVVLFAALLSSLSQ
jgi:hypothetical protein